MDWEKIWEDITAYANNFGLQLILSLIILFVGLKLIKLIKRLVRRSLERAGKLDKAARSFIVSLVGISALVGLVVIIMSVFNVQTVSLAAILGAAGLAAGLAFQGSLSNFAGGFLILVLKPFKPGDYIEIKDSTGIVEDMDIFYTKLRTYDNKKVVVPNSLIINNTLTNYTGKPERRIDLDIGVSYRSRIGDVKKVISETVAANELFLEDPPPIIRLAKLADSALIFHVRVWCKTEDYWEAFYGLTEGIKESLDNNGISIPYPQVDVHMKQDPGS